MRRTAFVVTESLSLKILRPAESSSTHLEIKSFAARATRIETLNNIGVIVSVIFRHAACDVSRTWNCVRIAYIVRLQAEYIPFAVACSSDNDRNRVESRSRKPYDQAAHHQGSTVRQ